MAESAQGRTGLASIEPMMLGDNEWGNQLESLIVASAEATGMERATVSSDRNPNGSPARPPRLQKAQVPLSDAEVRELLEPLARWHLRRGAHPWGVGGQAQEITKSYDFDSFADAIDFMASAAQN